MDPSSYSFRCVIKIILDGFVLRSWVQIPPGPFLSVRELRHYFELDFDNCRTKPEAMVFQSFFHAIMAIEYATEKLK
jgi:hypothetical protein